MFTWTKYTYCVLRVCSSAGQGQERKHKKQAIQRNVLHSNEVMALRSGGSKSATPPSLAVGFHFLGRPTFPFSWSRVFFTCYTTNRRRLWKDISPNQSTLISISVTQESKRYCWCYCDHQQDWRTHSQCQQGYRNILGSIDVKREVSQRGLQSNPRKP